MVRGHVGLRCYDPNIESSSVLVNPNNLFISSWKCNTQSDVSEPNRGGRYFSVDLMRVLIL